MAAACDHSPQQVCVAEIYADVRGEEMLTDNAATEQALRCLTSVDQLNQHDMHMYMCMWEWVWE